VQKFYFPITNFFVICSILSLVACGGGGSDGGGTSTGIQQGFGANDTSSHALQAAAIYTDLQAMRTMNPGTFVLAVSYVDFDMDGDVDVFMSSGSGRVRRGETEPFREARDWPAAGFQIFSFPQ